MCSTSRLLQVIEADPSIESLGELPSTSQSKITSAEASDCILLPTTIIYPTSFQHHPLQRNIQNPIGSFMPQAPPNSILPESHPRAEMSHKEKNNCAKDLRTFGFFQKLTMLRHSCISNNPWEFCLSSLNERSSRMNMYDRSGLGLWNRFGRSDQSLLTMS
jgi:hypothetical protein